MPHAEYPDLAQIGWDAYTESTNGLAHDGQPLPEWDDLPGGVVTAWQAAAQAVVAAYAEQEDRDAGTVRLGPPQQTPTVGRMILVAADPSTNNGADIAPAVITRVWNDSCINARIILDSDAVQWRTSLTLVEDLAGLAADDPARLSSWSWLPRV